MVLDPSLAGGARGRIVSDDLEDDDKPRGFGDLLQEIGNGELHSRVSRDLHDLVGKCRE